MTIFSELRDLNSKTRREAATRLMCMDMMRNEIPEIELLLNTSADPFVRESAIMAAGKNGFSELGDLILRLAEQDESPRVRQVAIAALVKLQYKECVPYFRECLSCSSGKDSRQLNYAVYALGEFRCAKSIDGMMQICRVTDSESLKASVIKALGKIAPDSPRKKEIIEFISTYKNDTSAILSLATEYVLEKLGGD